MDRIVQGVIGNGIVAAVRAELKDFRIRRADQRVIAVAADHGNILAAVILNDVFTRAAVDRDRVAVIEDRVVAGTG